VDEKKEELVVETDEKSKPWSAEVISCEKKFCFGFVGSSWY
jgi:hypothetical protein